MEKLNKIKKKTVLMHPKCVRDYAKLSKFAQKRFVDLFDLLERDGFLFEPDAKKINGYKNLFELRVLIDGNWRMFYGYVFKDQIYMAHIIYKKTEQTRVKDLKRAIERIKSYEKHKKEN